MEQLYLWDRPKFKINKPIRLIELFAGIGSQAKALENLGANFEHWKVCEFDKYAIASYHSCDFWEYAARGKTMKEQYEKEWFNCFIRS